MSNTSRSTRRYDSEGRSKSAEATRRRILAAARSLFEKRGIDGATVASIARQARVAASTVYGLYGSKAGIVGELMKAVLFGPEFNAALAMLQGGTDPVAQLERTADVATAIYESERAVLGIVRGASTFSAELRSVEAEFEGMRYTMQLARLQCLFAAGLARKGLELEDARRILWMYTSRDVYRMMVVEAGWSSTKYRGWLAKSIVDALVEPK